MMMMFIILVRSLLLVFIIGDVLIPPTESFRACTNNNNNNRRRRLFITTGSRHNNVIIASQQQRTTTSTTTDVTTSLLASNGQAKQEHDNYDSTTSNSRIIAQDTTRRSLLFNTGLGLASLVLVAVTFGGVTPVNAVSTKGLSEIDIAKEKIIKGYDRLNYLLDNWVTETTICGRDDNPYTTGKGCERTPIKVMDYLGYKNINDPLFRADKTLQKLEPIIPVARFNEYLDAIEKWSEAAEEGNGMAYISSWGEANPGGGKDRVQLFIERARTNVIDSRDSLAVVIDILNLK